MTPSFHRYIYQYLIKRGYVRSAAQYALDLAPTISKDLTVPADSPTGFLFEWWMVSCSILEPLAHPERWKIRAATRESTPPHSGAETVQAAHTWSEGHADEPRITADSLSTPEEWARLVQALPFSEAGLSSKMQHGLASLNQQIKDGQTLSDSSAFPLSRWPPPDLEHDPVKTDAIFLTWDRAEAAMPSERFVDQHHVVTSPSQGTAMMGPPSDTLSADLRLDWAAPPVGSPFAHHEVGLSTAQQTVESTAKQHQAKTTPVKPKRPRKGKAARKDTGASDVNETPRGRGKRAGQKLVKQSSLKDDCDLDADATKGATALLTPTASLSPLRAVSHRETLPASAVVDMMPRMDWLPAMIRNNQPDVSRWPLSSQGEADDGIDMEETLAECVRNFIDTTSSQAPSMMTATNSHSSASHAATLLTHPSTLLDSPLQFVNTTGTLEPSNEVPSASGSIPAHPHLPRAIIPTPRDFSADFRGIKAHRDSAPEMPIVDIDPSGLRDLPYHSQPPRSVSRQPPAMTMEEYKSALNLEMGRHHEQQDALMMHPLPASDALAVPLMWTSEHQANEEDDRTTPRPFQAAQADGGSDEIQAGQQVQEAVIAQFMEKFRGRIE